MNDQPNLRQFLDEVNSFTEEEAAAAPVAGGKPLGPIGKVLEIAGKYRAGEPWEYVQPAEFKL